MQQKYNFNIDKVKQGINKAGSIEESLLLYNLQAIYYESISDYKACFNSLKIADSLNELLNNDEQRIVTWNYKGYVYWHQSLYDSALVYHQKALMLSKEKRLEGSPTAFTLLMLGEDYYDLGDYVKTSEYYYKALALCEKLQDTLGQVQAHNRLSKLYYRLKDFNSSKKHISESQRLNKFIQNNREAAVSFNSIGNIQIEIGSLSSALHYFTRTYEFFIKCGDRIGQSIACINLGDTYSSLFRSKNTGLAYLDSSFKYYNRSYEINQELDNQFGIIYGLWGMADIDAKRGKFSEALLNYRQALSVSKSINAKGEEYQLYWKLYQLFELGGKKDSSYVYLKKYVNLKNSRESEEQTKALLRQESKYEIEKRLAEEAAKMEKERLIEEEKNRWKNYVMAAVVIIAIILIYVVISSVKRLKVIASKNELINTINNELTFQKKEITDSITYAKRIQEAILPSDNYFKDCGIHAFVVYKPKDIVAGDFYWLEKNGDFVFLAVADCTGHGVPGAMVSVVCSSALNRSVLEFGISNPAAILDKTRELVLETFSKSDHDVKDGMDISLLTFNKKTKEIWWAGANNPLWFSSGNVFHEIKADKQAIGKTENPKPFKAHLLAVKEGDMLYLFSDGYADQFGGEKGKKFMHKKMNALLFEISDKQLYQQKQLLELTFENWKGNLEQVDDVCVVGIRI